MIKRYTKEWKKKISDTLKRKHKEGLLTAPWKNKKFPDWYRKKLSIAQTGKKLTDEQKEKIGLKCKGENHWNWKGGPKTKRRKEGYYSKEYINWRNKIFERDNYTCQFCYKKGIYLEAHHILKWNDFIEFRFDLNNGITLCKKCHNKTKFKEDKFIVFCQWIINLKNNLGDKNCNCR